MVTLQALQRDKKQILDTCEHLKMELNRSNCANPSELKKQLKQQKAKLPTYKTAILYMETSPNEQFVINEKNRVARMIEVRLDGFSLSDSTLPLSVIAKMRKEYEKEHEVPKLRNQLKMLKFLLSK